VSRLKYTCDFPSYHQQWFSISIWTSICGDDLFGPYLLSNRLTGQNYEAFLKNNIPDFLADVPLIFRQEVNFMHDDALAHFNLIASRYLIESFLYGG
jgi:hypothetical protein